MPGGGWNKGLTSPRKGKGPGLKWLRDHVDYQGEECLVWPFARRWNGYGQIKYEEKMGYPHRVMCEFVHGKPPTPKHQAAHSCHNGSGGCVHPRHLSWKTPRENLLERQNVPDMGAWSTRRTNIPPENIAKIIELKGKLNQREIGKMFGISYQHVSVIQNRKLVSQ